MTELLHHLLEHAADDFPGSTAVVDGDREMTYRQLDTAANRIAHQLARLDVRRGDRIGLYLEKSAEVTGLPLRCAEGRSGLRAAGAGRATGAPGAHDSPRENPGPAEPVPNWRGDGRRWRVRIRPSTT